MAPYVRPQTWAYLAISSRPTCNDDRSQLRSAVSKDSWESACSVDGPAKESPASRFRNRTTVRLTRIGHRACVRAATSNRASRPLGSYQSRSMAGLRIRTMLRHIQRSMNEPLALSAATAARDSLSWKQSGPAGLSVETIRKAMAKSHGAGIIGGLYLVAFCTTACRNQFEVLSMKRVNALHLIVQEQAPRWRAVHLRALWWIKARRRAF